MTSTQILDRTAGLGRRVVLVAAKDLVGDLHERVVMAEKPGILIPELQLRLLLDFASRVLPQEVFDVSFETVKSPADGVYEGEISEPAVEGLVWSVLYTDASSAIADARFKKK